MPLEGGTLPKAGLTHFPLPSSTCMACWHVLLLGPCSYPESFSRLKLLKKIFPLLHKLNQVNEHASQMLFSSFPPHHGDSWAGTGQCHSTEVSGMMPIYISWWFEPLSLWHTSFPPSLDIKQSLEHVEVKTPTAGLNSHFHPCSCITTVQVLQKPLQSGHVSKAGGRGGRRKTQHVHQRWIDTSKQQQYNGNQGEVLPTPNFSSFIFLHQ